METGELQDEFLECFIQEDSSKPGNQFWNEKYGVVRNMVPVFIGDKLAHQVLLVGKSVNFLRYAKVKNNQDNSVSKPVLPIFEDDDVLYEDDERTLHVLNLASSRLSSVNALVLHHLFSTFDLVHHLHAMKSFLLLGHGDFVHHLCTSISATLNLKASEVWRYNLVNHLESALRASNAHKETEDVLKRVDIDLLDVFEPEEETGWGVFSLTYHLGAPLDAVVTSSQVDLYHALFKFLFQVKRVGFELSGVWGSRRGKEMARPASSDVLHRSNLLLNEMVHFSTCMNHYVMFEVVEMGWNRFVDTLACVEDVDQLIHAHVVYLDEIFSKSMGKEGALHRLLMALLSLVVRFCGFLQGEDDQEDQEDICE